MQNSGVDYLNVGDLRVLVRWGKKVKVDLEGKKNKTIVDSWNSTPADQDGAALLWSTSDDTYF